MTMLTRFRQLDYLVYEDEESNTKKVLNFLSALGTPDNTNNNNDSNNNTNSNNNKNSNNNTNINDNANLNTYGTFCSSSFPWN